MRLVCPNCDAEYEVDDAAVPKEGRDVQCSNCGHAWFQVHPETEAEQEAETDLYDAPPGKIEPAAEQMPHAAAEVAPDPEAVAAGARPATRPLTRPVGQPEPAGHEDADMADEGGPLATDLPPPRSRTLDETVLAVLREEAERESAARQTEVVSQQPTLESQTEMPLAPAASDQGGMAAAVRRIARMRGAAAGPATDADADADADAAPEPAPKSRSDMFPAIEEINSTLRATGDRAQDMDDAIVDSLPDLTRKGGGFRRGFLTLVLLGVLIAVLYGFAPLIGARVPALEGAAKAYVVGIDAARVWLDVNLRELVATLRGLAGGQGG
jgi:predicted Zn finger-like uncharacterized protein